MRRHMFTKLTASFISLSAVGILAVLMSPLLIAAERLQPPSSQETTGLAPSEPAPARAGRRAPRQNSSQAEPAASADPAGKPPIIVLYTSEVGGVLGRPVRSAANESMGRIIDIIVDQTGIPRAAVIDFGGFLGVGSRKIAVDWNALLFALKDDRSSITIEFTRDQVKTAPEYQEGKPITVIGSMNDSDGSRLSLVSPER
jgi:PRC-barrel domain protein